LETFDLFEKIKNKSNKYFVIILTEYDDEWQDQKSNFGEDPIDHCPVNRSDPFT